MKKRTLSSLISGIAVISLLGLCACDDEMYYPEGYYADYGSDSPEWDSYDDSYYDPEAYGDDYYPDSYGDDGYDDSYYDGYGYEDSFNNDTNNYSSNGSGYPYDATLGTARELEGNVAVVSVFISDQTTNWDFNSADDQNMYNTVAKDLEVATEYLEKISSDYGHKVNFISDWNEHPELFYEINSDVDYKQVDYSYNEFDYAMWEQIENNIPTAEILEKTDAQQVIYMTYFNTPSSNTITSCTRNYYQGMAYPYEICYMFMNCDGYTEPPACFAHEMLHTFGAPDLYDEDEEYGISSEYVQYAESSGLNDIMRSCEDPETGAYNYDEINNEVTDITAYYTGLTDYSETVNEWGFYESQHK